MSDKLWLAHHGIKGQKWGVRNGPPYPLNSEAKARTYGTKRLAGGSKKIIQNKSSSIDKIINENPKKVLPIDGLKIKSKQYTKLEDAKAVNPNYKGSQDYTYGQNCCWCTYSYDLRCRGYDVQAKGRNSDYDTTRWFAQYEEYWHPPGKTYYTAVGEKGDIDALYKKPSTQEEEKLVKTTKEKMLKKYPNGARGSMSIGWYFDNSGHCVAWEKQNDNIYIIDAQSGDIYPFEDEDMFKNNWITNVTYTRLDNLDIVPDKVKRFCK